MKSGSSSAIAFGTVLQVVRKGLPRNQSDVAASFSPKLSVAAVSMAESGNRPPKTEAVIRGYADALELDADALLELWWALQGMVEDPTDERPIRRWWRELEASPQLQFDYQDAKDLAEDESRWIGEKCAPMVDSLVLADRICTILRGLVGDTWLVDYKIQFGLSDPIDAWPATVKIELRSVPNEGDLGKGQELVGTFSCPEPVTRPVTPDVTIRPNSETISPDVAWILSSVEAMPVRERAAVAGFIHGLRQGASLFPEAPMPPHPAR